MEGQKLQGTDLGRGFVKIDAKQRMGRKINQSQEFMAAWDSEGSTIMLSSFKKKKLINF